LIADEIIEINLALKNYQMPFYHGSKGNGSLREEFWTTTQMVLVHIRKYYFLWKYHFKVTYLANLNNLSNIFNEMTCIIRISIMYVTAMTAFILLTPTFICVAAVYVYM